MSHNSNLWTIGVISTAQDLKNERVAVQDFLKKNGIDVSAFECSDFPIRAQVHPHDTCKFAIDRVDIVILLINEEIGSSFYADESISVTEAEFNRAYNDERIIKIPCIHKDTWQEYEDIKSKIKSLDELTHIKDKRVVEFIARLEAKENSEKYFTFFASVDDLINRVKDRLATSVSLELCSRIAKEQYKDAKNRITSIADGKTIGNIIKNDWYVEPIFEYKKGDKKTSLNVDNDIVINLFNGEKVLLKGVAGVGKSTVLIKSYLSYYEKYVNINTFKLPFFIPLRDSNFNYKGLGRIKNDGSVVDFDFENYINKCMIKYLHKCEFPFLNLDKIRPHAVLFIDGLDEILDSFSKEQIKHITYKTKMFDFPLVVAGRTSYIPKSLDFVNKFNKIIELKVWNMDKVDEYLTKRYSDKNKRLSIKKKLDPIMVDGSLIGNPLSLEMLLYLLDSEKTSDNVDPVKYKNQPISLFEDFIKALAQREQETREFDGDVNKIIDIWSSTAWAIYFNSSIQRGSPYDITTLTKKLKDDVGLDVSNTDIFDAVFRVVRIADNCEITGAYHEQILDYLVAKKLFVSCVKDTYPFSFALGEALKPEINRLFRDIWRVCNNADDKKTVCNRLIKTANDLINITDDNNLVFKCFNATYMLGRLLDSSNGASSLIAIKGLLCEKSDLIVKLSLYLSAVTLQAFNRDNTFDAEEDLHKLLISNPQASDAARGYFIAYYSDDEYIYNKRPPFSDKAEDISGVVRNLIAQQKLVEQFPKDQGYYYFIKRLALTLIMEYIKYRRFVNKIDQATVETIAEQIKPYKTSVLDANYPEYAQKVHDKFDKFLVFCNTQPTSDVQDMSVNEPLITDEESNSKTNKVVFVVSEWGDRLGGVNSFNYDVCSAMSSVLSKETKVVCLVLGELSEKARKDATEKNVCIVQYNKTFDNIQEQEYPDIVNRVSSSVPVDDKTIWIGHDIHTGPLAIALSKVNNGKNAVIIHANYAALEGYKENYGTTLDKDSKELKQRDIIANSTYVFAVGPRLKHVAVEAGRNDCVMIIPGLAKISENTTQNMSSVMTYGRFSLNDRIGPIKQSKLALASFGQAVSQLHDPSKDYVIKVVGLNSNDEKKEAEKIVHKYAGGRWLPVQTYSYTEDRKTLFETLKNNCAFMMLSITEGFGLAAWEAISAEVPLILSNKSGVYNFLSDKLGFPADGLCLSVSIKGGSRDTLNQKDVDVIAGKLIRIFRDPERYKYAARKLKESLKEYTWEKCACDIAKTLELNTLPPAPEAVS
ncbi:MAG: DUF4062 domain-containing protein [Nitrososphaerota archaeon]|jgi:hypothetical protein|nr:DUF4062 domain-containing protein [Nitrososphaerota archaeon]